MQILFGTWTNKWPLSNTKPHILFIAFAVTGNVVGHRHNVIGDKIQEDRDHAVVTAIASVNVLQERDVFLPLLELLLQLIHVLGDRWATCPVARAVNMFCSLLFSRVASFPSSPEAPRQPSGLCQWTWGFRPPSSHPRPRHCWGSWSSSGCSARSYRPRSTCTWWTSRFSTSSPFHGDGLLVCLPPKFEIAWMRSLSSSASPGSSAPRVFKMIFFQELLHFIHIHDVHILWVECPGSSSAPPTMLGKQWWCEWMDTVCFRHSITWAKRTHKGTFNQKTTERAGVLQFFCPHLSHFPADLAPDTSVITKVWAHSSGSACTVLWHGEECCSFLLL